MSRKDFLFTSESVTEGHPDKMADQISDAVLDAVLEQDKTGRVACETLLTTGLAMIAGEITTTAILDFPKLARKTINEIGYNDASYGFDGNTCAILVAVGKQSPDIAMGVNTGGAGDQGLMFGYACDDTEELMPLPISLAHKITMQLSKLRKNGTLPYLRPDGKSQVSVEYINGKPVKVDTVVVSSQHSADVPQETIRKDVIEKVVREVVPSNLLGNDVKYHVNPTGLFVVGGPCGDTGVTGRKIIVDTYGGVGSHGGGAFSGKDPSKVDRSASYAARHVAKNIVAAGLAHKCEVQVAYAIGVPQPVSIMIDTFGTGKVSQEKLIALVRKHWDLSPKGIISQFDLRRPIYRKTAAYGHFGRHDADFTWEKTDLAEILRSEAL
ncbi:MAG: methionine adenosyltransferase [Candidatus Schekmanbacteria bacterium]|nr:methionine adenosyltransferase [Candidatus Schekmanbacteria bacterium]